MSTARDIIQDAFEMLGVYATGETAALADVGRGLSVLNDMLDSWSNESLSCFAIAEQTGTLQVGVSSYTIGPGGAFNVTRPIRLIDGPGAAYIRDTNGNQYWLNVVPQDVWNMISARNVNSNLPDTLFYDPQFPLGIINIYPIPNMSFPIFFDSYLQLSEFSSLTAALSLPPGYKLALTSNLAVMLSPYYPAAKMNPATVQIAMGAKGNVKRSNIRENIAIYDPELVARAQGTYNIYTGGYGRVG